MSWIKGHFDGSAVVLDEPATFVAGQAVRIAAVESEPPPSRVAADTPWKGKLLILEDGDDVVLDHFSEYLP